MAPSPLQIPSLAWPIPSSVSASAAGLERVSAATHIFFTYSVTVCSCCTSEQP